MAASVLARLVYGFESVTLMPQSWTALARATSALAGAIAGSRSCPRAGSSASGMSKPRPGSGSTVSDPVGLRVGEPEPQPDVRVGDVAGGQVQEVVVDQRRLHGGVELQLPVHDGHHGIGPHRIRDEPVEDRRRCGGPGAEALLLLDAEVVVKADDHDRCHEDERQGDDAHEGDGQPGLERLRDAGAPCRVGVPRVARPPAGGRRPRQRSANW